MAFMPPTAHEIKLQLDGVVDQEGNVLNMEAALEIVATLETVLMTKEALETTRIGRTINLLRKKTVNEELARRAKKLLKKWQTLVNNHLKSINPDFDLAAAQVRARTPPVLTNGGGVKAMQPPRTSNADQPSTSTSVAGKKRKIPNTSPNVDAIKRVKGKKLPIRASPLLQAEKVSASPTESIKAKQEIINNADEPPPLSASTISRTPAIEQPLSAKPVSPVKAPALSARVEAPVQINITVDVASDSRIQENRIADPEPLPEPSEQPNIDNYEQTLIAGHSSADAIDPCNIACEDLEPHRRPLPEGGSISPSAQADGVNGTFDDAGEWRDWSSVMERRGGELVILPYVILN